MPHVPEQLPSLATLLESIVALSDRCPPPHDESSARAARVERDALQRRSRRAPSPRRTSQNDLCDQLSKPRERDTVRQKFTPSAHKRLLMARARESERQLTRMVAAAQREDASTQAAIRGARTRLIVAAGAKATGFFGAEDEARGRRIERSAQDAARRAISSPPSLASTAASGKDAKLARAASPSPPSRDAGGSLKALQLKGAKAVAVGKVSFAFKGKTDVLTTDDVLARMDAKLAAPPPPASSTASGAQAPAGQTAGRVALASRFPAESPLRNELLAPTARSHSP
jgi:hypothetical protein